MCVCVCVCVCVGGVSELRIALELLRTHSLLNYLRIERVLLNTPLTPNADQTLHELPPIDLEYVVTQRIKQIIRHHTNGIGSLVRKVDRFLRIVEGEGGAVHGIEDGKIQLPRGYVGGKGWVGRPEIKVRLGEIGHYVHYILNWEVEGGRELVEGCKWGEDWGKGCEKGI